MSADNWTICPKCEKVYEEKKRKEHESLRKKYGKMPLNEFKNELDRIEKMEEFLTATTLREDYSIGVQDGCFEINYSAYCIECGFEYYFKFNKDNILNNES